MARYHGSRRHASGNAEALRDTGLYAPAVRAWRGRTVVLIGVTLLALGAGSSVRASTTAIPAQQWTANFCGSILTWVTFIDQRTDAYNKAIDNWKVNGHGKISKIRGVVIAYVRDTTVSTDQMVHKVKAAGPPAVTNGAKTQSQVNAALGQVGAVFHTALTQARKLPTTNPVLFLSRTQALTKQIGTGFGKVSGAFAAIGKSASPALKTAGRTSPACQALR